MKLLLIIPTRLLLKCLYLFQFIQCYGILFIQFKYTIVKSSLLKHIANYALELGLNLCISAPTGKLASKYAMEHPMCRCNTIHSKYFNPVGNSKQRYAINRGLSDVHGD